ncbi:MAG: PepSY-like domain-containing protein [Chryseolinea sp.]
MKHLSVFFVLLCLVCSSELIIAQDIHSDEVPTPVKAAIAKIYTGKGITWSKEELGYEATFKQDHKETSLVVDASGNVLETETEIEKADLPASILESIKGEYSAYRLEEVAKIVTSSGVVTYETEVEKGKDTFELIFDHTGKLLSKKRIDKHD